MVPTALDAHMAQRGHHDPRGREMTQGHTSPHGPCTKHELEVPTMSPPAQGGSRRRKRRREPGEQPWDTAHAEVAEVAQALLLQQCSLPAEELSHCMTSARSRRSPSHVCSSWWHARGAPQALPCPLPDNIIGLRGETLRASLWPGAAQPAPHSSGRWEVAGQDIPVLQRPPEGGPKAAMRSSCCWNGTHRSGIPTSEG